MTAIVANSDEINSAERNLNCRPSYCRNPIDIVCGRCFHFHMLRALKSQFYTLTFCDLAQIKRTFALMTKAFITTHMCL